MCVLALTGCTMTEYGTHSLGTTPFVVPGMNSAEDGWMPRVESDDAYFKWKEKNAQWECRAWVQCRLERSDPHKVTFVDAHGETVRGYVKPQVMARAGKAAKKFCRSLKYGWDLGADPIGEPYVTCTGTPVANDDHEPR